MERALSFMPTDIRSVRIQSIPSDARNEMAEIYCSEIEGEEKELNSEIIEVSDTSEGDQMNTIQQCQTKLPDSIHGNLPRPEELEHTIQTLHQDLNEQNSTLEDPNLFASSAHANGQPESSVGVTNNVSPFPASESNPSSQKHQMCFEPIDANIKFRSFNLDLLKDQMNMCIEGKTKWTNQVVSLSHIGWYRVKACLSSKFNNLAEKENIILNTKIFGEWKICVENAAFPFKSIILKGMDRSWSADILSKALISHDEKFKMLKIGKPSGNNVLFYPLPQRPERHMNKAHQSENSTTNVRLIVTDALYEEFMKLDSILIQDKTIQIVPYQPQRKNCRHCKSMKFHDSSQCCSIPEPMYNDYCKSLENENKDHFEMLS